MVGFSLLARLSTGAYAVPLVLLIQGATGSYALAGGAEAANLIAGGCLVRRAGGRLTGLDPGS